MLLALALILLLVTPTEPASPVQVEASVRETPEGLVVPGSPASTSPAPVSASSSPDRWSATKATRRWPKHASARPTRGPRHPRTAAGVSRDGRTLLLIVVDGRRPGWSIGATLPGLAQLMLDAGAWSAVNLDGGGSSALWHREPSAATGRILNRPSDGHVRPVANHLGVRGGPAPPR